MCTMRRECWPLGTLISARVPMHVLIVSKKHGSSVPQMERLSDTVTKRIFEVVAR